MARPSLLILLVVSTFAVSANAEQARVETGLFPAGETFAPAESAGARQVSRVVVRTAAANGGRATVGVPATGGRLLLWTLSAPAARSTVATPAAATLHTPSGRALRGGEASSKAVRRFPISPAEVGLDLAGTHESMEVAAAEPGLHRIEVEVADGAVTVVAAEPDSPLTLATWASPLSRLPGQPVTLFAELRDGETPVRGASVSARLAAPGTAAGRPLRLRDDGHQGDAVAGDGVYSLRVAELPAAQAGFWTARFDAEGRNGRGRAFARSSTSGFMAERAVARLLTSGVRAERTGAAVVVQAAVRVVAPGLYRLDAIVAGGQAADGTRPALAWGELVQRLEAGTTRLRVTVPVGAAGEAPELVEVRLLALEALAVAGRTLVAVE